MLLLLFRVVFDTDTKSRTKAAQALRIRLAKPRDRLTHLDCTEYVHKVRIYIYISID